MTVTVTVARSRSPRRRGDPARGGLPLASGSSFSLAAASESKAQPGGACPARRRPLALRHPGRGPGTGTQAAARHGLGAAYLIMMVTADTDSNRSSQLELLLLVISPAPAPAALAAPGAPVRVGRRRRRREKNDPRFSVRRFPLSTSDERPRPSFSFVFIKET